MKNIYYEVQTLDQRCYKSYGLSEDILMENAATALAKTIKRLASKNAKVVFVCGSGNNGADGMAAARMLEGLFDVHVYNANEPKSPLAKVQFQRAKALHVRFDNALIDADIYVDCLFGSGLKRDLSEDMCHLIEMLNEKEAKKIACDIPSGIWSHGDVKQGAFKADITVCMGALKSCLYSDNAKDFVGKIIVADLGISSKNYEIQSDMFLLQKKDLCLPHRNQKNTHKGNFGHLHIIVGEKEGAGILAGEAAFHFGAGLVSVVSEESVASLPPYIMYAKKLDLNAKTIAIGMGLGAIDDATLESYLSLDARFVVDADLFYKPSIKQLLNTKKEIVLTPHPKEFCAFLALLGLANISVAQLQTNRLHWVRVFAKVYPDIVLVLKGANTIITHNEKFYINPLGSAKLAKGGSGDVLSGMIGALLAQGYSCLHAATNASIAHALASNQVKGADFSLTPVDICKELRWL
ncbi:MAG: NAD(P)H-hydrate dehydratase [Sulfurospirillum sp.]|nr:NAD(P)H-hydrate dehydratase [Sulfurospirillum sp.]